MLKIYNTLSKKKEIFKPIRKTQIGMYVCGPTVYGPSHLGHARTYVAFDAVRRWFEFSGFKTKLIVNVTDVHDDMIAKAAAEKTTIFELAAKYIRLFHEDLAKLNVKKAFAYPRVTQHIPEIIGIIKLLEKKGFAYRQGNSVYFRVSKFKDYGKLSGIKLGEEMTGTRVETDKYEKEAARDFVLWKEMKKGEPYWQSPWGAGRPGWHIECSAMAAKYLGKQIDVHGGATDLIFPHHENEIAQSEAAFGKKPFVRYFAHTGPLTVGGVKMSRSLGNYIEVNDLLETEKIDPLVLRFFILSAHYRSPVDYSEKTLAAAEAALDKIRNFAADLILLGTESAKFEAGLKLGNSVSKEIISLISGTEEKFKKEMNDDFNTPRALAAIFDFMKKWRKIEEKAAVSGEDARNALDLLEKFNEIFGVLDFEKKPAVIPARILELTRRRENFRKAGQWAKADEIRKKIAEAGYKIEDAPEGAKIKPARQN